jgi:RNA polymerase sigma factor (sigma-70 family)
VVSSNEMQKIVEEYTTRMIRLAYTYVKNHADAEDIAQEVFISYLTHCPNLSSEEHRKAWLYRVTMNKCKDHLKSGWKKRVTLTVSEEFGYIPRESSNIIETTLRLREKYRMPIYLFYVEDYSVPEIGALLKVKPSTVRTWLERGRRELREKYGGEIYE